MKYFMTLVIVIDYVLAPLPSFPQSQSPEINVTAESEGINLITWTENTELDETLNIYASHSPITDQTKDAAVKIASYIPIGVESWRHRPYTHDGSLTSYYSFRRPDATRGWI